MWIMSKFICLLFAYPTNNLKPSCQAISASILRVIKSPSSTPCSAEVIRNIKQISLLLRRAISSTLDLRLFTVYHSLLTQVQPYPVGSHLVGALHATLGNTRTFTELGLLAGIARYLTTPPSLTRLEGAVTNPPL
uniref:Uncharacterized protein n=1 Tax=Timema bartmani TaxID=61472 RepID=A0A7R9EUA3_9NEOP|nr:unnamed protein product [Timema bartmani]